MDKKNHFSVALCVFSVVHCEINDMSMLLRISQRTTEKTQRTTEGDNLKSA